MQCDSVFDHKALLFGLCHLVGLIIFGLILQKICVRNIKVDYSDLKKKNSGNWMSWP